MGVLRVAEGLAALEAAVAGAAPTAFAAAKLDLARLLTPPRREWLFYGGLVEQGKGEGERVCAASEPVVRATARADPRPSWRSMDPPTRLAWATRLASDAVAQAAGRPVPASEPIAVAGVDSLAAVSLRRDLSLATGLELPITLAFDYPTVGDLGAALAGMLGGDKEEEEGRGEALAPAHVPAAAAPPPRSSTAPRLAPGALDAGYATFPPLPALARLSDAALSSLPRFAVSRPGVGDIQWLKPVDVRGVVVGEGVVLERGRAGVVAEGLRSTPALVTFVGMLPPPGADAAQFEARLRKAIARAGWSWVSWEESGEWVVRVGRW